MSNSRLPYSAQTQPHERLTERLEIHRRVDWRQSIRDYSQRAFESIDARVQKEPKPIILDSGCGTAWSCLYFARQYPDYWVVGIDRSEKRLSKAPDLPDNVFLIRAELADAWRLMVQAHWRVHSHYVLYPNPYPKARQLQQRWHGHPAWPHLLAVCPHLVMRTNARVYALEWVQALHHFRCGDVVHRELDLAEVSKSPMSAFETKYCASGHPIFEVSTTSAVSNL